MPEDLEYPEVPVRDEYVDEDGKDAVDEYDDPLTFICQIRCSDLAALDPKGLLPHEGLLYFFGALSILTAFYMMMAARRACLPWACLLHLWVRWTMVSACSENLSSRRCSRICRG